LSSVKKQFGFVYLQCSYTKEQNPKISNARDADEQLSTSFNEVIDFFAKYNKEAQSNTANISEFQLHSRLKSIRADIEKWNL
jgi:hypothetical protein